MSIFITVYFHIAAFECPVILQRFKIVTRARYESLDSTVANMFTNFEQAKKGTK